jgi:hypothetical protein
VLNNKDRENSNDLTVSFNGELN